MGSRRWDVFCCICWKAPRERFILKEKISRLLIKRTDGSKKADADDFQDPFSSLNPRMTVSQIIAEPLLIAKELSKDKIDEKVKQLMELVGLAERLTNSYPHELDGGRRQRVGIARALALNPEVHCL